MTSYMYIHTCTHTHKGSYLPSQHCHLRAQATHTLLHLLLQLTSTPKHSRFPTITVTPRAHIRTISYSHSVSLPPVIRLASPPAKLLSYARSLIPPYSQVQLSKHLHISHTHTHTTALYWLVHHTPAQSTAGTRKPKGPVTSLSDQVSLVTVAQRREEEHISVRAHTPTPTSLAG